MPASPLSTPLSVAKSAPVLALSTTLMVRSAAPKLIGLVKVTSDRALAEPKKRVCVPPVPTKPPLPHVSPAPLFRVTVSEVVWAANPPPPVVPPKVIVPVPATGVATRSRAKDPDVWIVPAVAAFPRTRGLLAGKALETFRARIPSCTRVCPV